MGRKTVTRMDIASELARLNRLAGSSYQFTYDPVSGGYRIETASGACPFGHKRRVGKAMLDVLTFAADLLQQIALGGHR